MKGGGLYVRDVQVFACLSLFFVEQVLAEVCACVCRGFRVGVHVCRHPVVRILPRRSPSLAPILPSSACWQSNQAARISFFHYLPHRLTKSYCIFLTKRGGEFQVVKYQAVTVKATRQVARDLGHVDFVKFLKFVFLCCCTVSVLCCILVAATRPVWRGMWLLFILCVECGGEWRCEPTLSERAAADEQGGERNGHNGEESSVWVRVRRLWSLHVLPKSAWVSSYTPKAPTVYVHPARDSRPVPRCTLPLAHYHTQVNQV